MVSISSTSKEVLSIYDKLPPASILGVSISSTSKEVLSGNHRWKPNVGNSFH